MFTFNLLNTYLTAPTTKEGKCKGDPACELWDEEFLLDEQERGRHYPLAPRVAARPMVPVARFAPQPPAPAARVVVQHHVESDDDLDWMDDPRMSSCIVIPELPFELDSRHLVWAPFVHHQHDSQPQLRILWSAVELLGRPPPPSVTRSASSRICVLWTILPTCSRLRSS